MRVLTAPVTLVALSVATFVALVTAGIFGEAGHADYAAAKIAIFAASILAALIGTAVLWRAGRNESRPV